MDQMEGNAEKGPLQEQSHSETETSGNPPTQPREQQAPVTQSGTGEGQDKQKIDRPSRIQVYATVALVIITFFYTLFAYRQSEAMRASLIVAQGANEVARRSLETSQRPWVGVSHPIRLLQPMIFGSSTLVLRSGVTIKNFGPSVALNVVATMGLAPSHDKLDSTVRFMCEATTQLSEGKGHGTRLAIQERGIALFPNMEFFEPVESRSGCIT